MNPSSEQAHRIYRLFNFFNIAAIAMLLLVSALVVFICFKFRANKNDDRKAAQFKGNYKIEALMIGIPTLLIAWFFYETITTMKAVEPAVQEGRLPDVIITGHQFWWEVEYPKAHVITANEVHLPYGKNLLLELRSADVIHDWWVPELGNKMDVIPGIKNYLTLNIDKAGSYTGTCSEFCGAQHAWMRMDVVAENENDYNNWLAAEAKPAAQLHDTTALRGENIFEASSCAGCHQVQGTAAVGNVGPDLTHIFSRQKILAGKMLTTKDNLYKWLSNPQQVKPGSKMPDFIFTKDTLNALVAYISQLK